MLSVTKIASRYQVTLPRDVRKAMKARIGDLLVFVRQGDGSYRLQVVPHGMLSALRVAGKNLSPMDFRQVHREFEEGWADENR